MAKGENFYRRDPGAALQGMASMSLEERGVYNTVLDLLYLTWRPIEDSRTYIAAHCGCAVQKLNPILERLVGAGKLLRFEENGQAYISNQRFEDERAAVKGPTGSRSGRGNNGSGRGEVEEKSAGVEEKSAGVGENPPGCEQKGEEYQADQPLEKSREEKSRQIVGDQEAAPADLAGTAVGLWNLTAKRCALPEVRKLDATRRARLAQRLADGGLEDWRKALHAVERSRLCRGLLPGKNGAAAWRCNFDFLTSAPGYRKVLEGNYAPDIDPPAASEPGPPPSPDDLWKRRIAGYCRDMWWPEDWGPKPGRAGCQAPEEALAAHGYSQKEAA